MKPVTELEMAALLRSLQEYPKHKEVARRMAFELNLYKECLRDIACYNEGERVSSSFDCPAHAKAARDALEYKGIN